eukprot:m.106220 g.106220  ORF g.106220 m.106220 type:complete len:284 (-) comp12689_c0_seq1:357-1208(-)
MDRVHVRAPATQDIAKRSATGTTSLSKILWRNDQCARREEVGIYPRSVALGRRAIHWAAIGILIMATPIGAVGVFSGSAVQSKVLIENITELSLSRGAITTGRRSPGVPQMQCLSGCGYHEPSSIQCVNTGSFIGEPQWECTADLSIHWRFGSTMVICEGFDYPEDPFVLKGSCGLEYRLVRSNNAAAARNREHPSILVAIALSIVAFILLVLFIMVIIGFCMNERHAFANDHYEFAGDMGRPIYHGANTYPSRRMAWGGNSYCGGSRPVYRARASFVGTRRR